MTTRDALADLDGSPRRLLAAAGALPEPVFRPGGAARWPLEGAHHREHAARFRQ